MKTKEIIKNGRIGKNTTTDWIQYLKDNPNITFQSVRSAQIMEQADEDYKNNVKGTECWKPLDFDKLNKIYGYED